MTDERRKAPSKSKGGSASKMSQKSGNAQKNSSRNGSSSKASSKSAGRTGQGTADSKRENRTDTRTDRKSDSRTDRRTNTAADRNVRTLSKTDNAKKKSSASSSKQIKGKAKTSGKPRTSERPAESSQSHIRFAERSGNYRQKRQGGDLAAAGGAAAIRTRTKPRKKIEALLGFDYPFFMIVVVLLAIGLIMLFSASYATAYSQYGDSLYYIRNQVRYAAVGFAAMLVASVFDYHKFKFKPFLVFISVVSAIFMVLVKLKPTEQGGAERWLTIGPITFQPSEILKFVVILLFAYFAEKNFDYLREIKKGLLPFAVILMASCGLLMMQPHLSGTIIVFAIGFMMMYVAGVRPKYLILLLLGVGLLVAIAIPVLNALGYDYFTSRWVSFVAPESDIGDTTFQTYQSLVTIGSGGLFGLGFGNSRQKYSYLPMARNDFIFSIVCEELGFVGGMLVILLFVILVWRGFYICSKARDKFGMLIAFGITFQIGLQALMNIAVVSNSMPNTGISLPFFSYGGTALLMQLGEMGVLLNISRKAELD